MLSIIYILLMISSVFLHFHIVPAHCTVIWFVSRIKVSLLRCRYIYENCCKNSQFLSIQKCLFLFEKKISIKTLLQCLLQQNINIIYNSKSFPPVPADPYILPSHPPVLIYVIDRNTQANINKLTLANAWNHYTFDKRFMMSEHKLANIMTTYMWELRKMY